MSDLQLSVNTMKLQSQNRTEHLYIIPVYHSGNFPSQHNLSHQLSPLTVSKHQNQTKSKQTNPPPQPLNGKPLKILCG